LPLYKEGIILKKLILGVTGAVLVGALSIAMTTELKDVQLVKASKLCTPLFLGNVTDRRLFLVNREIITPIDSEGVLVEVDHSITKGSNSLRGKFICAFYYNETKQRSELYSIILPKYSGEEGLFTLGDAYYDTLVTRASVTAINKRGEIGPLSLGDWVSYFTD